VPVETGYFSLHGLSKQLETLAVLCQRCKQTVNVKVLASMYDIRTKMAREIMSELRTHFGDKMFKTVVNFNTKLKEASSLGQPIGEYDTASKGHNDSQTLAKEVLQAQPDKHRRQIIESLSQKLESISATAEQLLEQAKPKIKTIELLKPRAAKTEPVAVRAEPSAASRAEPATAKAKSEAPAKKTENPAPKFAITEAKLSDYYGVNQMNEAVVFVTLYPRAQSVQIAGDFNDWQPSKMQMEKVGQSGVWQASAKLSPGRYRYRLVVDGQWQQDPYNETTELNPFGGYNSVVEVKQP
jgi:hypothetical protein